MELHERIAFVRKAAGLTQEQLGEKLGVTRQAVSKWESNQATPDALTIARLCTELGVSADFVLLGKEPDGETASAPVSTVTCPCCGKPGPANAPRCQVCNYDFYPSPPDDEKRYAVILLGCSDTYAATGILMRFTDWDEARCDTALRQLTTFGEGHKSQQLVRRDLSRSAAMHISAALGKCCGTRIVADEFIPGTDRPAYSDEELELLDTAMPAPDPDKAEGKDGIGFWGIVGAVVVGIIIASFL